MIVATLLGMLVVLAWVFYASAQRYQHHLHRNELAQQVLVSYRAVSDHTYRKLNAMSETVANRNIEDIEERLGNVTSLRDALAEVRHSVAAEVAFVDDEQEVLELDYLAEIERLVEQIIRASVRVRAAVRDDRPEEAAIELKELRDDAVVVRFNELINVVLAEEQQEVLQTDEQAKQLGDFVATILPIAILIAIFVGAWMAVVLSRGLTRSVDALRAAAAAYASGNLEHRIDLLSEQEFNELGSAFNRMAQELSAGRAAEERAKNSLEAQVSARTRELEASNARLEHLDSSRRRLLSDISHELRTPLTVIQGESEMALRGEEKTAVEYREALQQVREQAMHTSRLVDDLLYVARAEQGPARMAREPIPIGGLLESICSEVEGAAERRNVRIAQEYVDEHLVIFGDAERLKQVFAILIDNAVRHSRERSTVRVGLVHSKEFAKISVNGDGIELTQEQARRAFGRIFRGGSADGHSDGGVGLGLPLVKAIVETHQGSIHLEGGADDGGLGVVVRLPVDNKIRAIA